MHTAYLCATHHADRKTGARQTIDFNVFEESRLYQLVLNTKFAFLALDWYGKGKPWGGLVTVTLSLCQAPMKLGPPL